MVALVGGHVEAGITNLPAATPHLRANRLRAIGVLSANRAAQLPEIPTFVESGFPVIAPSWVGVAAPAGVPGQIVDRLNAEIARIVNLPDVRERFASLGAEPRPTAPEGFSAFIRSEFERWTPLIKQSGARADN
jgi:tripartite-type tricarboxylate transporter receptor subunit TctC